MHHRVIFLVSRKLTPSSENPTDSGDLALEMGRPSTDISPLQKAIWRIRVAMMLEHALNFSSDRNFLRRIAQQVAHHAHAIGVRQFDKYRDVGTMLPKNRVGGVPDTLPTEDAPPRFDLSPF